MRTGMLPTAGMWAMLWALPALVAGAVFPVGIDFSHPIAPVALNAASTVAATVDASGSVYLIGFGDAAKLPATTVLGPTPYPAYFVMKLTPGASQIAYLTILGFQAHGLAVDASGNVYLAGSNFVARLNADGKTLAYNLPAGDDVVVSAIAADDAGHAYATGWTGPTPLRTTAGAFQPSASNLGSHAYVVRINSAGSGFDYATYVAGSNLDQATGIAVDGSGAAFIRGNTQSADFPVTSGERLPSGGPFVARLAPDGSRLIYAAFAGPATATAAGLAANAAGDAVVAVQDTARQVRLLRFDRQGTSAVVAHPLPSVAASLAGVSLALDAAGNVYVTGSATAANFPVKKSLMACGSLFLSVFDAAGDLVQSTYLGGVRGSSYVNSVLSIGQDGAIYITGALGGATDPLSLTRLSPNTAAQPIALACVGNAASFDAGTVAPGEIVSLFGEGLGPAQGVQPEVTRASGFPTRLAGVQVLFDDTAAPLLYVQDGQINAIAPWRLTPGQATNLCVSFNGATAGCIQRTVAITAPGVFTVDGVHAAALNQDGTLNTEANPAKPGSIVSIFATGAGPMTPTPADGAILAAPLPENRLPVMPAQIIGGAIAFSVVPIMPQYAGPAPLEVAGMTQVNFQVGVSNLVLQVGPQLLVTDMVQSRSFSVWVSGR